MPVLQARTREELRVDVGRNLGAVKLITSAANGSTTTFLTDDLDGGADDHIGGRLQFTGPTNNDGSTRRVVDSAIAANRTTLTFFPAGTSTVAADTAELWSKYYDPADIHAFINQAIIEATGLAFDPEESVALHADGRQTRFDLPAQFAMLRRVEYRARVESTVVHAATTAWDESVDGDVTASRDTEDFKLSGGSFKMVVATGASAGDLLATQDIAALDLSGYDYIELWIKSTVTTVAGNLKLLLDDTALCASPLETLSVPALTADTWTFVRIALANPELDTAIISVGLEYDSDLGACTIWVNDIKAVLDHTATWVALDWRSWRVDSPNRDLILTNWGRGQAGYHLLKLIGGDKPALLTADSSACEIDDQYVIARATELALLASSGGPQTDPDARRSLAGYWGQRAQQAKRGMPPLVGARMVS